MTEVWVVGRRLEDFPYPIDLSRFRDMEEAVEFVQKEHGDVYVFAFVAKPFMRRVSKLSTEEFVARNGIVSIKDRRQLIAIYLLLIAERLNLYHDYALELAEESEPKGTPVYVLMMAKKYKDTIRLYTGMNPSRFKFIRSKVQQLRAMTAHPSIAIACSCPPSLRHMDFTEIVTEDIDSEVNALYHLELPEDSPVLVSARGRNEKWADKRSRLGLE